MMKAIYHEKPFRSRLCVVTGDGHDTVTLEAIDDSGSSDQFTVSLGDDRLVLDPTDAEWQAVLDGP